MDKLLAKYGTSRNGHSIFAPSSSASWLNCSASLLINAVSGDSAGIEAAEGTVAHSVAEEWNKTGVPPSWMDGETFKAVAGGNEYDIEVTSNMLYHVERYVDWCREVPGEHYYEQRVDLSEIMPIPGQGGTADHFACEIGKLTITDLKYGTGVRVYAKNNTQALLYASGVFIAWDWIYRFEVIVIRICQPRLDVFETWEITRDELMEFMDFARRKAKEAWVENAPRTPSHKACMWCAGFNRCPARIALLDQVIDNTEAFDEDLEDEVVPLTYSSDRLQDHTALIKDAARAVEIVKSPTVSREVRELSTAALAYALGFRQTVERWFKAVHEELLDRAEKGYEVPFFELSEGRKSRKFFDPASAKEWVKNQYGLNDDIVAPRKILTVAKMEAAIRLATKLKPKEVTSALTGAKLVNTVQSKRTLVPVMDDRPREDDLIDDFDAEDDDL